MKFFLTVIVISLLSCVNNKSLLSKSRRIEFLTHLNLLDSISRNSLQDTISSIPCCSSSIEFMVRNTDVKISAQPGHNGFLYFTKLELLQWHQYFVRSELGKKQQKVEM